ncbi:hypothetical protein [Methylobacterium sp. J-070]|uniref:hypothetical protein n=1 Tax=Methylobacterium sp. J-070 TaxID=2836650 RepID=UPI001FB9F60E|nr:hypothetical protein [Methylobacterium sp. J-070]MCJ2051688.1 hypothetical protein [Methylobacterium sp. J-070]
MPAPDLQTCEAKIDGDWRPISLADAKGVYAMAPKRCPDCHGPVMLGGMLTAGGRRFLMHRIAHTGCPRDPKRYAGTPSPHPQALA